jgi:hypothetical protein
MGDGKEGNIHFEGKTNTKANMFLRQGEKHGGSSLAQVGLVREPWHGEVRDRKVGHHVLRRERAQARCEDLRVVSMRTQSE